MVKKLQFAIVLVFLCVLVFLYAWKESFVACAYAAIAMILLVAFAKYLFLFVNKRLRNTNWYKNQFLGSDIYLTGPKYRTDAKRNYDIANVGSQSGKFAFSYEESGLTGINWAIGSESLAYNFRVLKTFFSCLRDGGTIIFTMTPFGFCLKDYADDRLNTKYYLFLDRELILGYSNIKYRSRITYPLLSSPIQAVKRLIRDVPADNRLSLAANPMSPEELEEDAARWVSGWKKQFSISDLDAPASEQNRDCMAYNTSLLNEMISFCLERNLKPVIVLPPTTKALSSKLTESFCETYIYSIIHNANTHQVPFLNYLNDARFYDDGLFFNSFFLNAKGRKVFTRGVLSDLKMETVAGE